MISGVAVGAAGEESDQFDFLYWGDVLAALGRARVLNVPDADA